MMLSDAARITGCKLSVSVECGVEAVTEDSRRVRPGAIFVAVHGEKADGHAFVERAAGAGAVAVIGNRPDCDTACGVPYLYHANPRRALGILAHALQGNPSCAMKVAGITGTNGKSSTVLLTAAILESAGFSAAAFGTLGYVIGGDTIPAPHTTPFGEDLAALFGQARASGHSHVVMEVSSHSLEQERVAGIDFDVAAFTNLTQDHLDYHKDMESYLQAKLVLFERLEGGDRFAVVNCEDPYAEAFLRTARVPCITYGSGGDCRAADMTTDISHTQFTVITPWGEARVETALLGRHNVCNALCAIAIAGGLGIPVGQSAEGVASLKSVPGRFEHVNCGQPFQVVVDYAHTDDGLRNVLQAARGICGGKIIAVFGCGGDRDRGKRPKMAAVAAELADFAIITSDNPRTEDPERIILEIEQGMSNMGRTEGRDYVKILDRREAIREGIRRAGPGDLVMIAGKGHEDYQIIGANRIHFDDREEARAALEQMRHIHEA